MSLPKQASIWDERRNSSRVFPVPPNVYPDSMRALANFRRTSPAHVRWIEDGYPTLTEAEHLQRFGEPYKPYRVKIHLPAKDGWPETKRGVGSAIDCPTCGATLRGRTHAAARAALAAHRLDVHG